MLDLGVFVLLGERERDTFSLPPLLHRGEAPGDFPVGGLLAFVLGV